MVTFENKVLLAGVLKPNPIGAYEIEPPLHSSLTLGRTHLRESQSSRNPLLQFAVFSLNFFFFFFFFFLFLQVQIHAKRFPMKLNSRNGEGMRQ
jgi:hypothetical protein